MKRADCERRSLGIFANRETWDGEAEAERMSLASLLEAAFIACFLFLAIHRYLDILLELLLDLQKIILIFTVLPFNSRRHTDKNGFQHWAKKTQHIGWCDLELFVCISFVYIYL